MVSAPDNGQEHLLLGHGAGLPGADGWRAAALENVALAGEVTRLQLGARPGRPRPLVDAAGSFGGLSLATGLAVDSDGRIYLLDGRVGLLKRFDPCTDVFETLPCIAGPGSEPRQVRDPHGLAISARGDLYLADTGNRRVQVFALKGLPLRAIWGPLRVIREAGTVRIAPALPRYKAPAQPGVAPTETFPDDTWEPWDVAVRHDGRVYVSDRANGLIHIFSPSGRWLRALPDGDAEPLHQPAHIALDNEGRLYVVEEGQDSVAVFSKRGEREQPVRFPPELAGRFCPLPIAVGQDGTLYICDPITRRFYRSCRDVDGCHRPPAHCREFEGQGVALAFDLAGNPLIADAAGGRVVRLDAAAAFETEGRFTSAALDSRIYRCPWDRVVLRRSLAPGTFVRVETFTSEAEKTAAEVRDLPDARWTTAALDTTVGDGEEWDCLVQSPPGRYLWLRLTLAGDGASTPVIERIKVYAPRASSFRYLPAVYSADPVSRDFLDRYLSIFDSIRRSVTDTITEIARYFDPASTPAEPSRPGAGDFLTWLASWMGLALERHWPEARRRELLRQAHCLYALRGTPEGLRLHIKLYTGIEPRIVEHYRLRRWLFAGSARLGDDAELWGKAIVPRLQLNEHSRINSFQLIDSGDPLHDPFHVYAHQFTVHVPLPAGDRDTQRRTLERIVEMAKPAHTRGDIEFVEPRMRVGVQALVGVNTVIGCYPDEVVEGESRLGRDAVLGPSADEAEPPTMRVGVRGRIGTSTVLD
jgi:phage tail-like protein